MNRQSLHRIQRLISIELQREARRWGAALQWGAIVLSSYLASITLASWSLISVAPGHLLMSGLLAVNPWIQVMASALFARTASEEFSPDAAELVQLTELRLWELHMVRLISRFIAVIYLLLLQTPFLLLAVTLGGVTSMQVAAIVVWMLVLQLSLAAICFSAQLFGISPQMTRSAAFGMLCVVHLLPLALAGVLEDAQPAQSFGQLAPWSGSLTQIADFLRGSSLVLRPSTILSFRFDGLPISLVEAGHILGSLLLLTWAVSRAPWGKIDQPKTPGETSPVVASLSTALLTGQWRPADRPDERSPLVWKDFHFGLGGRPRQKLKWGIGLLVFIGGWMAIASVDRETSRMIQIQIITIGCVGLIAAGHASTLLFRRELQEQTWNMLLLTALSPRDIARQKSVATLRAGLPEYLLLAAWFAVIPLLPAPDVLLDSWEIVAAIYSAALITLVMPTFSAVTFMTPYTWRGLWTGVLLVVPVVVCLFSAIFLVQFFRLLTPPESIAAALMLLLTVAALAYFWLCRRELIYWIGVRRDDA